MNILSKLKETAVSVLPVMGIVLFLGFTIVPLDKHLLAHFVAGGLLLIIGLTVFLLGVDLGIQPIGERTGSALTQKRSLPLLLGVAFIIGFIVTAAEPDIQVFGDQVRGIFPFVNKLILTFVIAAGVGLFIMLGLLRSVLNLSLKWTFFLTYTILFVISFFSPASFFGIAFDSGGATTGPMTVPFIMALGLGVSTVRDDNDNSFGLTGVCSIGPVMAVLIYSIILNSIVVEYPQSGCIETTANAVNNVASIQTSASPTTSELTNFSQIVAHVLREALISIAPLFALFVIFQIVLLKMTRRQVIRIIIGFIYAFTGLTIFLVGVNSGFSQTGAELGEKLGLMAIERGGIWYFILILTGLILGAIIVCAEPAVWVLSEQVENVSGGTIKRRVLLVFLSIGTSIAIALAMLRAVTGFNLKIIIIPGYIIAMILLIFCPSMFSGIAFDSGGVASGPLTSTFVLSFTLGAATFGKGGNDSFGVIALVAMMPLIAIQLMGIIFRIKQDRAKKVHRNNENAEVSDEL